MFVFKDELQPAFTQNDTEKAEDSTKLKVSLESTKVTLPMLKL